jgi:hypothetical protein
MLSLLIAMNSNEKPSNTFFPNKYVEKEVRSNFIYVKYKFNSPIYVRMIYIVKGEIIFYNVIVNFSHNNHDVHNMTYVNKHVFLYVEVNKLFILVFGYCTTSTIIPFRNVLDDSKF